MLRQVVERTDGHIADAHLVVKVRPRRASGRADLTQLLAALQLLSDRDFDFRQVAVARRQAVAVVNDDHLPVAALPAGLLGRPVCGGDDGRTGRGGDVLAGMKLTLASAERVAAY